MQVNPHNMVEKYKWQSGVEYNVALSLWPAAAAQE